MTTVLYQREYKKSFSTGWREALVADLVCKTEVDTPGKIFSSTVELVDLSLLPASLSSCTCSFITTPSPVSTSVVEAGI